MAASSPSRGRRPSPPLELSFKEISTADQIVKATAEAQLTAGKLAALSEDRAAAARSGTDASASTAGSHAASAAGTTPMALLGLPEPLLSSTVAVKLDNNRLTGLDGFAEAMARVLVEPTGLQLLDLSFNSLGDGIADGLAELGAAKLAKLYLHGNGVKHLSDVEALAAAFPELRALTLHGCPVRENEAYRHFVISTFPKLFKLDFTPVTPGERDAAVSWRRMTKVRLHKTSPSKA